MLDLEDKAACYSAFQGAHTVHDHAANMSGMDFIELNKVPCLLSVLIKTHLLMAAEGPGIRRFF